MRMKTYELNKEIKKIHFCRSFFNNLRFIYKGFISMILSKLIVRQAGFFGSVVNPRSITIIVSVLLVIWSIRAKLRVYFWELGT